MLDELRGAVEAEKLLEELEFEKLPVLPVDVVRKINSEDFRVVMEFTKFSSNGILGKAEGNSKGALIYVNSNIPDAGRLNFTAAHEIGHVCLHILGKAMSSFVCGENELYNHYNDPIEKEANGFASGMLLPSFLINKITDGEINWSNISQISEDSGASLEAVYRRLITLNNDPFALIIHRNNKFVRFVSSSNFGFFIEQSILSYSRRELCVNALEDGFPTEFDTVNANEWINPYHKGIKLDCLYTSSINLKNTYTYTLITYDDDCIIE